MAPPHPTAHARRPCRTACRERPAYHTTDSRPGQRHNPRKTEPRPPSARRSGRTSPPGNSNPPTAGKTAPANCLFHGHDGPSPAPLPPPAPPAPVTTSPKWPGRLPSLRQRPPPGRTGPARWPPPVGLSCPPGLGRRGVAAVANACQKHPGMPPVPLAPAHRTPTACQDRLRERPLPVAVAAIVRSGRKGSTTPAAPGGWGSGAVSAGHGGCRLCRLAGHRIGQYAHLQQCAPGSPRAHSRQGGCG